MAGEDTCQEYGQPPFGLGNLKVFVVLFIAQADACASELFLILKDGRQPCANAGEGTLRQYWAKIWGKD